MKHERVKCASLKPDPKNARKHSPRNLDAIKKSLERFGQQRPIVVDAKGVVIAGNGTLEAAKALGWEEIEIVRSTLKGSSATAYAIADNRTAELAEWDDDILGETLAALKVEDEALALVTGFDESEIVNAIGGTDGLTDPDEIPEPPVEPITKTGDLWLLGDHRVLCGDSTRAEDVARLVDGDKLDICFTSPPYASQRDYTKESTHKDWDSLMCGVMSLVQTHCCKQVFVNLGLTHKDNAVTQYWSKWLAWMESTKNPLFAWYVWDQGAGMMGDWNGRLAPSHEFIFHFTRNAIRPNKWCDTQYEPGVRSFNKKGQRGKDGVVTKLNSPSKTGCSKKMPDSVIRISRNATIDMARNSHPATFPIQLPEFFLKSWCGSVYDPFLGSGTTLIAAERLGRKCYGMEIAPQYCDVIVRRWEEFTGKKATLESRA